MASEENIKVIIRIRPNHNVDSNNFLSKYKESNTIIIPDKSAPKVFSFDKVADETTTQDEIFQSCAGLFESFFNGYNATIFAYGQTSSGKTYTMSGDTDENNFNRDPGLIPQGLEYIFNKIEEKSVTDQLEYLVKCSFVEIYNEQLFDLLDSKGKRVHLKVNLTQGVYVDQLTEKVIPNSREALTILQKGLTSRHVASTAMNRESSRSHAVFSIILESSEKQNGLENIRKSVLHLVDLAGSERQRDTKSEGTRLKEAGSINKSLHILGQVISSHVDIANGKKRYIRYRESKLTQLLKDSIGGNSKTFLVACVHPDIKYISETMSTLQFATHVKMIKNKAKVNIDVMGNVEMLKKEVSHLRELLQSRAINKSIDDGEVDIDSIWKKRFTHAMVLRACASKENVTFKEQLVINNASIIKLESIIENLKDESQLKEDKIQRLQRKSMRKVNENEEEIKKLVESALSKIQEDVKMKTDHVELRCAQVEMENLRLELDKLKNLQSMTLSESSLLQSLYKDYNSIVHSGELDNGFQILSNSQMETTRLQEELTNAKLTISQLNSKNCILNLDLQTERRKLESEIASMKSIIKDNEYRKEEVAEKRRTTMFNFSKKDKPNKGISPIKLAPGINVNRRRTAMNAIDECDDECDDEFMEWSDKMEFETLVDDLKHAEEKQKLLQSEKGKLEYTNKELGKDVEKLKKSLEDKEELESKFNEMKEKYNLMEIEFQESRNAIKKLENQLNEITIEKNKSVKRFNEKITNLESDLDEALTEKNSLKDELEVAKNSLILLQDEFLRNSETNLLRERESLENEEAIKIDERKSDSEEFSHLTKLLSEANESIFLMKESEVEHTAFISDLENRLLEKDQVIDWLQSNIEEYKASQSRETNEILRKHREELDEQALQLEDAEKSKQNREIELISIKAELDHANKELDEFKEKKVQNKENILPINDPIGFSSPISKNKSQSQRSSFIDELVILIQKSESDLATEKKKNEEIKHVMGNIFVLEGISKEDDSLTVEDLKTLEAKLIVDQKDVEHYMISINEKNQQIKLKNDYIYDLSTQLTEANKQRVDLKKQYDGILALLPTYGHENMKQKIKLLAKLKDDLLNVRNENLQLTDKFNRLMCRINQCDLTTRNFILNHQ